MRKLIIISILTLMYTLCAFGETKPGSWGTIVGAAQGYGEGYFIPNTLMFTAWDEEREKWYGAISIWQKEDKSFVFGFRKEGFTAFSKYGSYSVNINGTYDDVPISLNDEEKSTKKDMICFTVSKEDAFKIFKDIFSNEKIINGKIEFLIYNRGFLSTTITAVPTDNWGWLFSEE